MSHTMELCEWETERRLILEPNILQNEVRVTLWWSNMEAIDTLEVWWRMKGSMYGIVNLKNTYGRIPSEVMVALDKKHIPWKYCGN